MTEQEKLVLKFRMTLLVVCCIFFMGSLCFVNTPADETMATVMAVISFIGAYKLYDDIKDSIAIEDEDPVWEEPEDLEDIVELTDGNLEYILDLLDDGDIDVEDAKLKILSLIEIA
jgi:hypothetical protein